MDGGATAGAVTALVAVVGIVGRLVIYAERYERAKVRQRQRERGPAPVSRPAATYALPAGWPEDLKRQLVRCMQVAVERGFVTPGMLQLRAGVASKDAARMIWALEHAGIVGPRYGANGQARTLLSADAAAAALAALGIVEDARPSDAEQR